MKLKQINKALYRKRLNVVIVGFIIGFAGLSIAFGSIFIALFSSVDVVGSEITGESSSNFNYNFLGVLVGLLTSAGVLHRVKNHQFFNEIYYVWQLKQIQNLIYRKFTAIKASAKKGDVNAMIIVHYYYESLKQIYKLDDNTITMSTVEKEHQEFLDLFEQKNVLITIEQFDKSLLNAF